MCVYRCKNTPKNGKKLRGSRRTAVSKRQRSQQGVVLIQYCRNIHGEEVGSEYQDNQTVNISK